MEIPMPSRGYKFVTCPTDLYLLRLKKRNPNHFWLGFLK